MKPEFDDIAKMPGPPNEKVCNMCSGFMIGCVHAEAYKNCPKDKYTADASCDAIKTFVDKCGFLYPMKTN